MKSKLNRYTGLLASLLLAGTGFVAQAVTINSPVLATNAGWDCVMSGNHYESGIMFLTFNGDNTVSGTLISTRIGVAKVTTGRSGAPSTRNPADPVSPGFTNIYGFTPFSGWWTYDVSGNTIGLLSYQVVDSESDTTNVNQISIKAKITPNKRLTASYSSSLGGNGVLRGIPMPSTITNLSGSWTGEEKNGSLRTYEWFGLTPSGIYPYPNIYWQTGYGPGYDFSGYCMVSGQKKIAFGDYRTLISPTETNIVRRATVGSFIKKTTLVGGNTKGLSDLGTNVISYNAFLVTPLVEATKQ